MKKVFFTLVLACLGGMLMAQENKETEFKMTIGDTVVWQPFSNCNAIDYVISGGKVIEYELLKYGEQVQIIANKEGKGRITATCKDDTIVACADFLVKKPYVAPIVEKPVKPATQPFTGTYTFNPPTNHFFITVTDPSHDCKETYVKVDENEAYNDGRGFDRFWNLKTGQNWYYCPDSQGWTDDVNWEIEALRKSFFPLNAFDIEVDKTNLSDYYVGMERVLDTDCWKFFVDYPNDMVIQYWVDPANGCTLKRQVDAETPSEVTVYDLKYTKMYFGPSYKKSLHDKTR